jgi:cobalt-zinc-cadmium efflux system outer membrane protein
MNAATKRLAVMAAACLSAWYGGARAQPLSAAATATTQGTMAGAASAAIPATSPAAAPAPRPPTTPTTPIDLAAAIRLALEQPGLRAAALDVAASEAALKQAASHPNPELAYLREGHDAGSRTATIQVNQAIELGGKRRARMAVAEGEAGLARSALAARRREVRAEVIAAYYTLLVAQERQALAQALTGLARQGLEVAAKRVAAGKISPIDETKARLAALDASTELAQAGAELAVARTRLGLLVGEPAGAITLVEGQGGLPALPELPPLTALLARATDAGDVGRARSQLAASQAQAAVERSARVPDLTLSLGSQRVDGVDGRQAVFGVSVPLPLFNRNQGNLTAALRRSDKAREELAAAQLAGAAELRAAHVRYGAARSEALLLRQDVIPSARKAHALTLKGFEAGKFAFLDVLDAQRTWFQAQSRHAAAVLAAWRAYADIERLAGAIDPTH